MTTTYYSDGGPGPANNLYRVVNGGEAEAWHEGAWHPAPRAKSDIRWGGWLTPTDDVDKAKADIRAEEIKYAAH